MNGGSFQAMGSEVEVQAGEGIKEAYHLARGVDREQHSACRANVDDLAEHRACVKMSDVTM